MTTKTYGTITRTTAGRWRVEAVPFVLGRVKRAFPGLSRRQHGGVSLSAREDVARDLVWFVDRWPLEVDPELWGEIVELATTHKAREDAVVSILDAGARNEARPPPGQAFDLRYAPRPYQQVSANLVLATGRLLNCDQLGLGKTVEAIATFTDPRTLPAVVVTKAHLVSQWVRETQKFAPNLKVSALKGRTPHPLTRGPRGRPTRPPDVVVLNYHCIAGWADALGGWARSLILDEGHEIRRKGTAKYAGVAHVAKQADFRHIYTATPVMNYSDEILSLLDVLAPGEFGTREEFRTEWGEEHESLRVRDPAALGSWLRDQGYMLARTRADVGRELPPVTRTVLDVEADPGSLQRIQGQAGELAKLILSAGGFGHHEKIQAGQELLTLVRQATGIAKAPAVAEHVRDMLEDGERVVLFGWHRAFYDVIAEALKAYRPAFYTGSESPAAKDAARRRFLDGDTPLLVMSLRSGEGLNGLQDVCRIVVFGELDWSPGVHEQCIGRLNRDGQTEGVFAYYAVADTGSDPIVADILGAKKADADGIMGVGEPDPSASGGAVRLDQARIEALARSFFDDRGADTECAPTPVRPPRSSPVPPAAAAAEARALTPHPDAPIQLGLLGPAPTSGDSTR